MIERRSAWHASCTGIGRKRAQIQIEKPATQNKSPTGKLPVATKPELAAAPAKNNGTSTRKLARSLGRGVYT